MARKLDRFIEVAPHSFQESEHFYPRVPNAVLHPLVRYFLGLGNRRVAERYCHLHPEARPEAVHHALARTPRHFRWAGADLFHTTTEQGIRRNVIVEVNSSPSGQKSMPLRDQDMDEGGYRTLLERSFIPLLRRRGLPAGALAVLWDKNEMEVAGYAAVLANLTRETVLLVHVPPDEPNPSLRFDSTGVLEVRDPQDRWVRVRAAMRYVTQRPWTRIPPVTRTAFFNPVLACLAGGRNKLLAAKAYDFYNAELAGDGLSIRVPETIWDVGQSEVPLWVSRMGGVAVVKNPYSNAGVGVYTITSERELQAFMATQHRYDRFIVQALIGNSAWSSRTRTGHLYHVGTVPTPRGEIYVADLRFMVGADPDGFYPVALYARRAREPLASKLDGVLDSWAMLGTNLSVRSDSGWTTEPERLLLMDSRDFNQLGLGLDDLIEAYLQTVLAVTAIDRMAAQLLTKRGRFRHRFFRSINPDPALADEILR